MLEIDPIKQAEMNERKNDKRIPQKTDKASQNQAPQQKSHPKNKHMGKFPL